MNVSPKDLVAFLHTLDGFDICDACEHGMQWCLAYEQHTTPDIFTELDCYAANELYWIMYGFRAGFAKGVHEG